MIFAVIGTDALQMQDDKVNQQRWAQGDRSMTRGGRLEGDDGFVLVHCASTKGDD